MDSSNAYETHAQTFLDGRDQSLIGSQVVETWGRTLRSDAAVVELGCGGGYPITRALQATGLKLWAVDSSPTLVSVFQGRFPDIPIECAKVQESVFFHRTFDAALAIGLLFLLPEEDQLSLIKKVARILNPGGRFLFTAPIEIGSWTDLNTGITCQSLGQARYEACLHASGFKVISTLSDKGDNNYYDTELAS